MSQTLSSHKFVSSCVRGIIETLRESSLSSTMVRLTQDTVMLPLEIIRFLNLLSKEI
jgi:hypothetical protein